MKINPESSEEKEHKLIDSFRSSGDLSVLGALYKPYLALVYGVCLKYLKQREDAQDAVNNIFEELIIKLPKQEVLNFKSWLYVVTKNHCLMLLRKNKSQGHNEELSDLIMESDEMQHPNDNIDLEENLVKLESCIAKLKAEQKICIELFYLKKLCYQEIVEQTKHDLKKVKSYIQNGKRNLKLCVEGSE